MIAGNNMSPTHILYYVCIIRAWTPRIAKQDVEYACSYKLSTLRISVSKTTRELQLYWSESHTPVTVATDLKMPQFTIRRVTPTTCNEQFHLGELRS